MTRKTTKNDGFSTVFCSFWVLDPILALQTAKLNSVDNFASLETPGGSKGIKVMELFVFEKYFSCFLDGAAAWRKKLFSSN